MKKINRHLYIGKYILLVGILGIWVLGMGNITHAALTATEQTACDECKNECQWSNSDHSCTEEEKTSNCVQACTPATPTCPQGQTYDKEFWCILQEVTVTAKRIVATWDETVMWITMGPTCLKNWQCGFNIYEFLGFEGKSNDPTVFVQDILLSASFFIGTVITIALIYSGFLFVTAGISGNSKNADSAKNWIKYSIIGLLIVICSYSLIRLVQYIAKGL